MPLLWAARVCSLTHPAVLIEKVLHPGALAHPRNTITRLHGSEPHRNGYETTAVMHHRWEKYGAENTHKYTPRHTLIHTNTCTHTYTTYPRGLTRHQGQFI